MLSPALVIAQSPIEHCPERSIRQWRDADTFFGQELPALRQWTFGPTEAARIKQPVLLVMGGRSHEVSPVWQQRQDLLTAWMSNAEPFVLDGATHMLHLENARGLAERLGAFFTHPPAK